jgi:hypothetical protein
MNSDRKAQLQELLSTASSAESQAKDIDPSLHHAARELRYQVHQALHTEITQA